MDDDEKQELRDNSGIVGCASLFLRRALKERLESEEDPQLVDRAVNEGFEGNWEEFRDWAEEYLVSGCGVSG